MQAIFVLIALTILAGFGHTQNMPAPGDGCGVFKIKPKAESRIVNGEAVTQHSRPYQALLVGYFPNGTAKHYCGASFVLPTHVLTAAHCVVGYATKDIRIFPALHNFPSNLSPSVDSIVAKQIFTHESYKSNTLENDVAIVRLQDPVTVDNEKIGLICLADSSSPVCAPGHPVAASGWGATTGNRTASNTRPTQLQQVYLQCMDKKHTDCKRLTYTLGIIEHKAKLCAFAQNKGVCFGDSGGPLVRERTNGAGTQYLEQVGIMSGTIDCSLTKPMPDVYAHVRELHAWVLGKIRASP